MVDAGGALLIDDSLFTENWVRSNVVPLVRDRATLGRMAITARSVGKPYATARVLEVLEGVAGWSSND
jgi:UDP-N-acetylglucosamine:LPS N-acetylglucosamine transferase